jgi:hypothetical protein
MGEIGVPQRAKSRFLHALLRIEADVLNSDAVMICCCCFNEEGKQDNERWLASAWPSRSPRTAIVSWHQPFAALLCIEGPGVWRF